MENKKNKIWIVVTILGTVILIVLLVNMFINKEAPRTEVYENTNMTFEIQEGQDEQPEISEPTPTE